MKTVLAISIALLALLTPCCVSLADLIVQGRDGEALERIDVGAQVGKLDERGRTPLHYAVETGSIEVFNALLDRNVLIDLPDSSDATPLDLAVQNDRQPMVEMLLARGADPNRCDTRGVCACHLAVNRALQHHELGIVKALIESEARFSAACRPGQASASAAALQSGDEDLVDLLLLNGQIEGRLIEDAYSQRRITQLMHCGSVDQEVQPAIREFLVEWVDIRDASENTPLLSALGGRQRQQAVFCLELGADVSVKNRRGEAPLDLAMAAGFVDVASIILDRGVRTSERDSHRIAEALVEAARQGNAQDVVILLEMNRRIPAGDDVRRRAMSAAVEGRHHPVVSELIEAGVLPSPAERVDLARDCLNGSNLEGASESALLQEDVWIACQHRQPSIAAIERYLAVYPEGVYAQSAADSIAYATAEGVGTVGAYRKYLLEYPNGLHAESARSQIAKFDLPISDRIVDDLGVLAHYLATVGVEVALSQGMGAVDLRIEDGHLLQIDFTPGERPPKNVKVDGWPGAHRPGLYRVGRLTGEPRSLGGKSISTAGEVSTKDLKTQVVVSPGDRERPEGIADNVTVGVLIENAAATISGGSIVFQGGIECDGYGYLFAQGFLSLDSSDLDEGQFAEGTVVRVTRPEPPPLVGSRSCEYVLQSGVWRPKTVEPVVYVD